MPNFTRLGILGVRCCVWSERFWGAVIRFFIADKALLLRGGPVAERFYLVICGLLGLPPLGLSLAGQGQAKELAP